MSRKPWMIEFGANNITLIITLVLFYSCNFVSTEKMTNSSSVGDSDHSLFTALPSSVVMETRGREKSVEKEVMVDGMVDESKDVERRPKYVTITVLSSRSQGLVLVDGIEVRDGFKIVYTFVHIVHLSKYMNYYVSSTLLSVGS